MLRSSLRLVGIGLLIASCGACTTVRSTLFSPDGSSPERVKRHLKGTPTTIPVASHIKLIVTETRYLTKDGKVVVTPRPGVPRKFEEYRSRDLSSELILKDELFTVDLKRPAAGLIDFSILFRDVVKDGKTEHQQLKQIETLAVDETIVKSADFLDTLLRAAKIPALAQPAALTFGDSYEPVTSQIAVAVFDLNDPNLNEHLRSFVGTYFENDACRTRCEFGVQYLPPGCVQPGLPGHTAPVPIER